MENNLDDISIGPKFVWGIVLPTNIFILQPENPYRADGAPALWLRMLTGVEKKVRYTV